MFGVVAALVGAAAIAARPADVVVVVRRAAGSPALSALSGSIGLITFYLALQEGKASVVVPMIGLYPAIVALLAVAFLDERLSVVQYAGVLLAVTGVVLLGAG